MERGHRLNALAVVVAGVSLGFASSWAHAQGAPAFKVERPALKVGDEWTFNRIDLWKNEITAVFHDEVIAVNGNDVTLRIRDAKKPGEEPEVVVETLDLNEVNSSTGRVWSPYFPRFVFPLVPGETWDRKSTMNRKSMGGHYEYETKGVLQDVEQVTEPAGTFQAVKVKLQTDYRASTPRGQGSGTMSETIWYAPKADFWVKMRYHDTSWSGSLYNRWRFELVSYKLK